MTNLNTKYQKAKRATGCAICGKQVTEDDYCYGCKSYICMDCFNLDIPMGIHAVAAHVPPTS